MQGLMSEESQRLCRWERREKREKRTTGTRGVEYELKRQKLGER